MRRHSPGWMHKMTLKMTRMIATILLLNLLAADAAVAENKDSDAETAAAATAAAGKNLCNTAHTTAVEAAIDAVLAANKLDLDIRFTGRTSMKIVDGR